MHLSLKYEVLNSSLEECWTEKLSSYIPNSYVFLKKKKVKYRKAETLL